ncbi:MAG: hypothetical protein AAF471_03275, partial [Myxococcota bacterium]
MVNKKRAAELIGMGLIGLLCVSGCDGNKKPTPAPTSDNNTQGGPTGGNDGQSNVNPPSEQGGKQVVTTCGDLSLDDCEKTLFGDKRCKKDGGKCVEDTSNKAPESCGDLEEDDCNKSLACAYDNNECKDDNTYRVAPCKDKEVKDCKDECRVDTVLPVCLKNERSGRCVFDSTKCVVDGAGCKDGFGGLCVVVEEANSAGTCDFVRPTARAELCHWLADGKNHAAVKLKSPIAASTASANLCANGDDTANGSPPHTAENQCSIAFANVGGAGGGPLPGLSREYHCSVIQVVGVAGQTANTANHV